MLSAPDASRLEGLPQAWYYTVRSRASLIPFSTGIEPVG